MTQHLFGLEGDGNVANHRLQCGNFGPGQEDVSDSVGRWRTEEHETQLEVNTPSPHEVALSVNADVPILQVLLG